MEGLGSRGVHLSVSVGAWVWLASLLWGPQGPGADPGGAESLRALRSPPARSLFLLHRLPPVSSVLWAGRLSLPWQGQRGGPARGPWPRAARPQQAKDSLSWEGTSPGLQLLLPGGAGAPPPPHPTPPLISQHSRLSPGVSTPEGAQSRRPS